MQFSNRSPIIPIPVTQEQGSELSLRTQVFLNDPSNLHLFVGSATCGPDDDSFSDGGAIQGATFESDAKESSSATLEIERHTLLEESTLPLNIATLNQLVGGTTCGGIDNLEVSEIMQGTDNHPLLDTIEDLLRDL